MSSLLKAKTPRNAMPRKSIVIVTGSMEIEVSDNLIFYENLE